MEKQLLHVFRAMVCDRQIRRQKVHIAGGHGDGFPVAGQNGAALIDVIQPGKGEAPLSADPPLTQF